MPRRTQRAAPPRAPRSPPRRRRAAQGYRRWLESDEAERLDHGDTVRLGGGARGRSYAVQCLEWNVRHLVRPTAARATDAEKCAAGVAVGMAAAAVAGAGATGAAVAGARAA